MTKTIYLHRGDSLRILPETKEFLLGCCNCDLVHLIKVKKEGDNVSLQFFKHETEIHSNQNNFLEEIMNKMEADLEKAWRHIESQSDKTNREYWFMTEWKASLDKHLSTKRGNEEMRTQLDNHEMNLVLDGLQDTLIRNEQGQLKKESYDYITRVMLLKKKIEHKLRERKGG